MFQGFPDIQSWQVRAGKERPGRIQAGPYYANMREQGCASVGKDAQERIEEDGGVAADVQKV